MSEQKLRDAFDHMGPDEATRQRMLANILAEHEAGSLEQSLPNAQAENEQVMPFTPQIETQIPTHAEELPKRRRREFSVLRYALPLAACLIFAALAPQGLSQLVSVNTGITSTPPTTSVTSSTPVTETPDDLQAVVQKPEDQQSGDAQTSDAQTSDAQTSDPSTSGMLETPALNDPADNPAEGEPPALSVTVVPAPDAATPVYSYTQAPDVVPSDATPSMAKPSDPWPPTLIDYAGLALSLLACLAALLIAIGGIVSWRRNRQK